MANDINVNLYDVVAEAEAYFENIDKTKKGSGWKAYQRWLYENEPKYYPSGIRNNIESNFVSKEYKEFLSKNPSQINQILKMDGRSWDLIILKKSLDIMQLDLEG